MQSIKPNVLFMKYGRNIGAYFPISWTNLKTNRNKWLRFNLHEWYIPPKRVCALPFQLNTTLLIACFYM